MMSVHTCARQDLQRNVLAAQAAGYEPALGEP